ncbi:Abi family protein [Streptococcus sp. H31]|uniref:Abi family protein n=1 Tax=Streptococcus huangxiaojuni TaxID=3237239 RepID=UPI0034A13EE3
MEVKAFKTWNEQVAKLIEHGCEDITSEEYARGILQRVNYYRLTAYFLPFRDVVSKTYDSSKVSLEKIYQIYSFDSELRLLLLECLEVVELYLRTQVAYHHANLYGALAYKEAQYFNKYHRHNSFLQDVEQELQRRKKDLIYQHHQYKYGGQFPIWVLVEFFTFGMTSKFFADAPTAVQQEIAKSLGLKTAQVRTYLEVAVVLRNFCAHYNRLYYTTFSKLPGQLPPFIAEDLKLKHRLMAQLYAVKMLYPDQQRWNENVLPKLEGLITKYREAIHLHHIGFTDNWQKVLRK